MSRILVSSIIDKSSLLMQAFFVFLDFVNLHTYVYTNIPPPQILCGIYIINLITFLINVFSQPK